MVHIAGQLQTFIHQQSASASLAQIGNTPEADSLIFSGPQFFIALISGLILAFGFQMLLTNLSVAIGMSVLSASSGSSRDSDSGMGVRTIGIGVGLWTLITVSIALFSACFLAVKMGLFASDLLGAITGLVIWALYFTSLVLISSTTVGSLVGSVVSTATSSFQAIMGTATAALGAQAVSSKFVATASATAAAVRQELLGSMDSEDIQDKLQGYIKALRSPQIDLQGVTQEFEQLLADTDLSAVDSTGGLQHIDRQTFVDLVSSRTDLAKQEINRIADQLYKRWQQTVGQQSNGQWVQELMGYFQSATPDQLVSDQVAQRLDQLLDEMRQRRQSSSPSLLDRVLPMLSSLVMGRTDLSDMDANRITGQIKMVKNQLVEQVDQLATQFSDETERAPSIVRADVENYLLNTYVWQMSPERLRQDFWSVLYDQNADPGLVRRELEQLDRTFFAELLESRGLLSQTEIRKVSQCLDGIRQNVLKTAWAEEATLAQQELLQRVETYLTYTPKAELFSEMGDRAFQEIIQDPDAETVQLHDRLNYLNHSILLSPLAARSDLNRDEAEQVIRRLEPIIQRVNADAEGLQQAAKVRIEQQQQKLQDYLRNTGKAELNPDGIKRDLKTLLDEPEEGIRRVRARLTQFDRDTLVQLLSQRDDLSEAEVNNVIDQVESNWHQLINAPASLAAQTQAKYDQATSSLEQYLKSTGKPELNPEGIKRDLQKLMDDPKVGAKAIRDRLSHMDRDTLVQLLSQRDDLSEADVNQIIDQIQSVIQQILRAPQRLARRAQAQAKDFQTVLEDYLSSTEKAELNPQGIKRDLQLLLEDPSLGAERIGDRLSRFDRSTLVALLSQRDDLSEEEINQVIDQVLAVRDQIQSQITMLQRRFQAVIERIFAKIRAYLNSLERPELDYEDVKRDVLTLFDDPQAGVAALRDRLSRFDRDTLVAVVSSHDAISEPDANRVIDQIESARDSVLHRAERIEHQLEQRLNDMKCQAQRQLDATQKAAVIAAWWLFSTALISGGLSAFAGSLAAG